MRTYTLDIFDKSMDSTLRVYLAGKTQMIWHKLKEP
jgi:hypothetical protein